MKPKKTSLTAPGDVTVQTRIPLIDAAIEGDIGELSRLLAGGSDVNARDELGNTALHWASRRRRVESIEVLLDAGADIEARNEVLETPLIAGAHDANVVNILVRRGANLLATDNRGYTALMAAADEYTASESVMILIRAGSDVDAATPRGFTALMTAVSAEHLDAVRALLEAGVNVNARESGGATAIQLLTEMERFAKNLNESPVSTDDRRVLAEIRVLLVNAGASF